MRAKPLAAASAVAVFTVTVLAASSASAHRIGLSRGSYRLAGDRLEATLVFAGAEIGSEAAARRVIAALVVQRGSQRCAATRVSRRALERDGVAVDAHFHCSAQSAGARLSLRFDFLDQLAAGHRHLATLVAGKARRELVAYKTARSLALAAGATSDGSGAKRTRSAGAFFFIGIEHILLGFDHLAFLFALIIVGGRLRALAGYITAFTVAHSVTLAVSVLGILTPSPSIIEPAIALTIAYVGVANLLSLRRGDTSEKRDRRWMLAFAFGLIHGFGFAGALGEIGLPASSTVSALLLFNLGVEAGQLAVLSLLLPMVMIARRRETLAAHGRQVASASVAALGLFWFFTRVA
ncbi:MAG: HupE/UreJ family protein [Myxococcales bacterium]|nr:HupE/UreJ family protein [Myxococcales bacterium]